MVWKNTPRGPALAIVLLMVGCSKPTAWDYETVEGDSQTLSLYGKYGWEMVSESPASDGMSKFIFRRAADADGTKGEFDDYRKDAKRITEEEYQDATGGRGAEPEPNPKEDERNRKEEDEKLERQAGWETQYLTGTGNDDRSVIARGVQSKVAGETGTEP